jgi:serine/threonine-protein kinase
MLADLGLAKSYMDTQDTGITQTGIACGTPLYFSPEQAKGSPNLDIRSDIYSLGITLFHLLNGSPPFTGESAYVIFQKHVHEALPPFKAVDPPIPDSVFRVLQVMTEKDPTKRYATCSDMLAQFEALRQEILTPPPAEPKNAPSRKGILERLGIKKSSSGSNRND